MRIRPDTAKALGVPLVALGISRALSSPKPLPYLKKEEKRTKKAFFLLWFSLPAIALLLPPASSKKESTAQNAPPTENDLLIKQGKTEALPYYKRPLSEDYTYHQSQKRRPSRRSRFANAYGRTHHRRKKFWGKLKRFGINGLNVTVKGIGTTINLGIKGLRLGWRSAVWTYSLPGRGELALFDKACQFADAHAEERHQYQQKNLETEFRDVLNQKGIPDTTKILRKGRHDSNAISKVKTLVGAMGLTGTLGADIFNPFGFFWRSTFRYGFRNEKSRGIKHDFAHGNREHLLWMITTLTGFLLKSDRHRAKLSEIENKIANNLASKKTGDYRITLLDQATPPQEVMINGEPVEDPFILHDEISLNIYRHFTKKGTKADYENARREFGFKNPELMNSLMRLSSRSPATLEDDIQREATVLKRELLIRKMGLKKQEHQLSEWLKLNGVDINDLSSNSPEIGLKNLQEKRNLISQRQRLQGVWEWYGATRLLNSYRLFKRLPARQLLVGQNVIDQLNQLIAVKKELIHINTPWAIPLNIKSHELGDLKYYAPSLVPFIKTPISMPPWYESWFTVHTLNPEVAIRTAIAAAT